MIMGVLCNVHGNDWGMITSMIIFLPLPRNVTRPDRALCRMKVLSVTHVLMDTWMLTAKPVYKLLNVSDDLKWTTNTHVTPVSMV